MPCSRLVLYCRPEAKALLEHVSKLSLSRLGSVAKQGMETVSPSRVRILFTIDLLKGLSGSAKNVKHITNAVLVLEAGLHIGWFKPWHTNNLKMLRTIFLPLQGFRCCHLVAFIMKSVTHRLGCGALFHHFNQSNTDKSEFDLSLWVCRDKARTR